MYLKQLKTFNAFCMKGHYINLVSSFAQIYVVAKYFDQLIIKVFLKIPCFVYLFLHNFCFVWFLKLYLFHFMCMIICLHVCMFTICVPGASPRSLKRESNSLKLKVKKVVSLHAGTGSQTQVLWKNIQCSNCWAISAASLLYIFETSRYRDLG